MRTKWFAFLAALLVALSAAAAQGSPGICLDANAGWGFDLRLGVEAPVARALAVRAEAGASLFSLEGNLALTYGLAGVWYFAELGGAFDLGLVFGLPDAMLVFAETPFQMLSFGAAATGRWRFADHLYANLRLGVGYPLFIGEGGASWGGTAFLGLWPDARLGIGYAF